MVNGEDPQPPLPGLIGKYGDYERERNRLLRKKSQKYDYETVPHSMISTHIDEGWEQAKLNKNTARMRRDKRPEEALKDRLWALLAKMEFDWIGEPDDFHLQISNNRDSTPKQIDGFAIDKGAVMIFECMASNEPQRKSLRKELQAIVRRRDFVSKNLKKMMRRLHAIKWNLVLSNIELNQGDRRYAEGNGIGIIDDVLLSYFEELRKNTGLVSRYQFLGDMFPDVQVPRIGSAVPAIRSETSEGSTYYVFSIKPSELLPLAYVSHMKTGGGEDPKSYQRMVKGTRLRQVKKFIEEDCEHQF